MQFLILGILLDAPLALYDVHKRFSAGISLFYAASFGSIQRALRQLEAQGWARTEDAPDTRRRKKLYVITDSGRAAWHEWMMTPVTGADTEQLMLARIYLLGHLPPSERSSCVAVIRARVVEDAERLRSLADEVDAVEVPGSVVDVFRYQRATLDYGIRSHALGLAWLDEIDNPA